MGGSRRCRTRLAEVEGREECKGKAWEGKGVVRGALVGEAVARELLHVLENLVLAAAVLHVEKVRLAVARVGAEEAGATVGEELLAHVEACLLRSGASELAHGGGAPL